MSPTKPALGGHLRVVGEPADVVRAPDPHRGEPEPRRLVERDLRRPPGDDLARGRDRRRGWPSSASRRGPASPAAGCVSPFRIEPTYCGTRMTPCESCPRRLARTRSCATQRASSSGTPRAAKIRVASACSRSGAMASTSGPPGGARGFVHSSKRPTGYHGARQPGSRARGPRRERRGRGLDPRNARPYRAIDGAPGFPAAVLVPVRRPRRADPRASLARPVARPRRHARSAPDSRSPARTRPGSPRGRPAR